MITSNKYIHCGAVWTVDHCDSFHNDLCPNCDKEIQPISSIVYKDDNTEEIVNHVDYHIFEITLAGHSAETEDRDSLVFWVVGESVDQINQTLSVFSKVYDTENVKQTDLKIDDSGIDFSIWDSFDFIKSCFVTAYENVSGEYACVEPTENSSFEFYFEGRIDGIRFIGNTCYVVITDADDDGFDCEFKDFVAD